jgi:alkylation response protein AidB-like acyl-CoA dehydrogenase
VDLGLGREQREVRELFGSFFARECPIDLVRAHQELGFAPELWKRLADTGAPAMAVDERFGGGGAGLLEAGLVAEEVGRRLAPVPFVEHAVATRLLARAGGPAEVLAAVVDGARVATLALRPGGDPARLVPAGAVAGVVLALDPVADELVAVVGEPPSAAVPNLADAPLADRALSGPHHVLAGGEEARALHSAAVVEWRALTAAALVGLAEEALRIGVEYVKEREQFGVPIGSFQSIQHGLAEIPGQLAGARLLAAKAAWAVDHDSPDAARLALMAGLFAVDVAGLASRRAMHYHGGYGVMTEYDIQLYFRRARGWFQVLDSSAREVERLADVLVGPRTGQG